MMLHRPAFGTRQQGRNVTLTRWSATFCNQRRWNRRNSWQTWRFLELQTQFYSDFRGKFHARGRDGLPMMFRIPESPEIIFDGIMRRVQLPLSELQLRVPAPFSQYKSFNQPNCPPLLVAKDFIAVLPQHLRSAIHHAENHIHDTHAFAVSFEVNRLSRTSIKSASGTDYFPNRSGFLDKIRNNNRRVVPERAGADKK